MPRQSAARNWTAYVRLYVVFVRACLLREMMFRANFLVRLLTHVLWLGSWRAVSYFTLLACGVAILYSLLVILAALSVWTVRNQEMYELCFYILQFGNYPDEIYRKSMTGRCVGYVLTYVFPILLAVNVPARYGAMLLDRWQPVAYLGAVAIVALAASRAFFKFALRSYQGASS